MIGSANMFKVQSSRFKVQNSRFKVQSSRFKVQSYNKLDLKLIESSIL